MAIWAKDKLLDKIFSYTGILVQESYLPEDGKIKVQNMNSGFYFLNITNQKNQYKSTFIKQ